MTLEQALAIIALIDERAPLADRTCVRQGITLSEAARLTLIDERHPAFVDPMPRCPDTLEMFPE